MQRILTALIIALIAVSCKTKKKSTSLANPTPLGDGTDDSCAFNVADVPDLPPVPAGSLKVTAISLSADFPGEEEKVEFSVKENTNPDSILYEGYQRDGNTKFSGAAFGRFDINPMIPAGTLSITAWACVESSRQTGGNYTQKTYEGHRFLCGAPTEKTLSNNNTFESGIGLALAQLERKTEQVCMDAYDEITSEDNYRKAAAAKNEVLANSILGLRSMKKGLFTKKCVNEAPELVSATEYASTLNFNLTDGSDGCIPAVNDDFVDDYVSTTPPPFTPPSDFVLPPVSEPEPEDTDNATTSSTTEDDIKETVSSTTTPEDAKAACKRDNENREEQGIGGAEWDPQKGICFYHNNEKEIVNSIEPSIPKSEVPQEEVVAQPNTQPSGLSTGQKWGLSFFLIGGAFSAGLAGYKYQSSKGTRAAPLDASDTINQVELLRQQGDLQQRFKEMESLLARTDIELSSSDRRLLEALKNELGDRINAQSLNADLIEIEKTLNPLKDKLLKEGYSYRGPTGEWVTIRRNGEEKSKRVPAEEAKTFKDLDADFNAKSTDLIESLWRVKIVNYTDDDISKAKSEADEQIAKVRDEIVKELYPDAKDASFSQTDLDEALNDPKNTKLKELDVKLKRLNNYKLAFDDVELIKANSNGADYLKDIHTRMFADIPEMRIKKASELRPVDAIRANEVDITTRIDPGIREIDIPRPVSKASIDAETTKTSKLTQFKNYTSDWKGKGVVAGVSAAIIGAGVLVFGLTGGSAPSLAEKSGTQLSFLKGCEDQLLKTGRWEKKCQEFVSK